MSTEYEVYSEGKRHLTVYEHSSYVDLCLENNPYTLSLRDLAPEHLAAIGVDLIKIAGYQDSNILTEKLITPNQMEALTHWAQQILRG